MVEMTRREMMLAGGLSPAATEAAGRPNILFICSDQHTGGALGINGHPIVKTPHLDRLAAGGVSFRHAYSGNPVCAPGRASMMTGRFASDVRSYCNSTPFDGNTPTWGNRLRDAGYHCQATGKLDLWHGKDFGFLEFETSHGHSEDPDITSLFRSPVCFRSGERNNANGSYSDRPAPDLKKAQRVMYFLREESRKLSQPWCMYVGCSKPHPKFDAASRFREIYPPEKMPLPRWPEDYLEQRHPMFQVLANFKNLQVPIPAERVRRARSAYFGLISELDEVIGMVLDELVRTGQRENTLIVYTSDHGEMLGEHGLWLKNVLLENAVRVPLILAGPGVPKGQVVNTPVSHVDAVATMLEAGGGAMSGELRGHSLLHMDRHPGFAYSESHSEGNCTGSFMIRKGNWKYLYFTGGDPLLFDMSAPDGEFRNLAKEKQHAPLLKEMHALLTSKVDPDKVTAMAFEKQEQVLQRIVHEKSKGEFVKAMQGRLGSIQAHILAEKCYRRASA
jgi:choline-sulfatase